MNKDKYKKIKQKILENISFEFNGNKILKYNCIGYNYQKNNIENEIEKNLKKEFPEEYEKEKNLLLRNLFKDIKEETRHYIRDTNYNHDFSIYEDLLKYLNFKKICTNEHPNDNPKNITNLYNKEYYYWNQENSMLVQATTYNGVTNSINIICQGLLKKGVGYPNVQANKIQNTKYQDIKSDLRDRFLEKLKEIEEKFDLIKNWKTISSNDFYASINKEYEKRKDKTGMPEDSVWIEEAIKVIEKFPRVVQNAMLEDIISVHKKDEEILKKLNISKNYFNPISIIERLPEEDLLELYLENNLKNTNFRKVKDLEPMKKMIKELTKKGVENSEDFSYYIKDYSYELITKKYSKEEIEDLKIIKLKKMSEEELKEIKDVMEQKYKWEPDNKIKLEFDNLVKEKNNEISNGVISFLKKLKNNNRKPKIK